MDLGLTGKVALVTGARTGIGRATADLLASEGAIVVGVSRQASDDAPNGVEHRCCDLAIDGAARRLISDVVADHGGHDILVNNAAVAELTRGVQDFDRAHWQRSFDLNLFAVAETVSASLEHLERRHGSIVNVSSVNAFLPSSEGAAYSATKAGLTNLTKAIATQFNGRVRANVVSPGLTATPMWLGDGGIATQLAALDHGTAKEIADATAANTPLRRFLEPTEIAAAILFLVSPIASAITGVDLVVDGGLTPTI